MEGLTVTKAIVVPNLPFTLEIFVNFKNKIQIDWVIFLLVYTSIQCQLNCTAAERIVAAALILCAEQNMLEPYRTRVPFCCFGMTRNVKRGPESTIWVVDPSGRSTYLLMWIVHQFWHTGGFDDKKVRKFDFATSIDKKHIN